MQYFTFIGMGDKDKGYSNVVYTFEEDENELVESCFVQELILQRHKDQCNKVFAFVTKESRERYQEKFLAMAKPICDVEFIDIDYNASFEFFVTKLLENMTEGDDIILDITHSFRNIPTKLLFAFPYIEATKKVQVLHLYYGKLDGENGIGIIQDFIQDYQLQKVSNLLSQFDKTLILNQADLEEIHLKEDKKLTEFMEALDSFNKTIELCEFDQCKKTVTQIYQRSRSINKEQDKYALIIPFIQKIIDKFESFDKEKVEYKKKIILCKILLDHQRYQVAITFIDQLFREEIIRVTMDPYNFNYKYPYRHVSFYDFSQFLMVDIEAYDINENHEEYRTKKRRECLSLIQNKQENIEKTKQKLKHTNKETIKTFYSKIRNCINHATSITSKYNVVEICQCMLDCIEEIGNQES